MSFFSDMMAPAKQMHDAVFQAAITITEPGGQPVTYQAVLYSARTEDREDEHGRKYRVTVRDCRVISAETGVPVTSVRHDATVTTPNGATWSIDQVSTRTAAGILLTLRDIKSHDIRRPRYRGKP